MDYDKLNGYLVQLLDGVEVIQTANNNDKNYREDIE